jgi:2-polyprenyl-6-methoxyphenol hydroxylase-like FAD-dependent oxidoreductase
MNILPKSMRFTKFEHPPIVDRVDTKRFAFPLILQQSEHYAATRTALIGDAAHRVHPMAGQGLNIGLTDVAYLANAIVKGKKSGLDIGNYDLVLKEYERNAKINANAMISAIEFVKNSYINKVGGSEVLGGVLSFFRNAAIDAIQMSEPAKYNFMNYASGNLTHPVSYEWDTRY